MAHITLNVHADLIEFLTWSEDNEAELFHGGNVTPEAQVRLKLAARTLIKAGHTVSYDYSRIRVSDGRLDTIILDGEDPDDHTYTTEEIIAIEHIRDEIRNAMETSSGIQEPYAD